MQPRIRDILRDARRASDYIAVTIEGVTLERYVLDEDLRSIVERKLIVVGEVLVRVRQNDPTTYGLIEDARAAIALRNIIVHDYNNIDDSRVFLIVQELLPILRATLDALLDDESPDQPGDS
ncbi:MAG: HepT-like ribonuclease domain-containing protein [Thermomicrobiales bacterium]